MRSATAQQQQGAAQSLEWWMWVWELLPGTEYGDQTTGARHPHGYTLFGPGSAGDLEAVEPSCVRCTCMGLLTGDGPHMADRGRDDNVVFLFLLKKNDNIF